MLDGRDTHGANDGAMGSCPFHASAPMPEPAGRLGPAEELVLLRPKLMVAQYVPDDAGARELHLYYGDRDITFDDPAMFAFGEALAAQHRFTAGAATTWGPGYDWSTVRPLLTQLLDDGVLVRASALTDEDLAIGEMVRPSPLPAAVCARPRTWAECETVTAELTGRAVEVGYLELIVPFFRVAHMALDADGRQVGEANVFPRTMRLDVPTTWVTCAYPGTRHLSDRPMNVTALKAMRLHWKQIMAAVSCIRAAYLRRFPDATEGWTVGRIERLAAMMLAVPTYQLVRGDRPLANGALHPALSSLFRVTDGVRMTMHQMLFIPVGEPTKSPDLPMTSAEVFEYAERNYSFHSETGVCGGPKHMIQQLLRVLIDGEGADEAGAFPFDAAVRAALDDVDAAIDYGLYGLQAYGAFFSLWPAMTRAYEQLGTIAETAVAADCSSFDAFGARMRERMVELKTATYLGTEEWRQHREVVYADMYAQCAGALSVPHDGPGLTAQLTTPATEAHFRAGAQLGAILERRFGAGARERPHIEALRTCLMDFFARAQAVFRASADVQTRLNAAIHRPQPTRPFGVTDADVHNILRGEDARRIPYLFTELADALDLDVHVDVCRIDVTDRRETAAASH